MPPILLPSALRDALRRSLEPMLQHTYTRGAAGGGTEDDWGETDPVTTAIETGVPCLWAVRTVSTRDAGGITLVSVPTLTVSATDPIEVGDVISAITGSDGVVLAAGPFRVERLIDDTAGLGAALLPTFELRGARVTG